MRRTRLALATLACACAALPLASCDVRSTPPLEAPAERPLDSRPGPPMAEGALGIEALRLDVLELVIAEIRVMAHGLASSSMYFPAGRVGSSR